ncbi:hypothetical protein ACFO4O_15345 [Glaciecola siphonariae]|uniref:Uncharacterized protein n=1 Tax=Glaciecola siphonariae TaxID=521012 RepID=A0ABV9LYZ8_9ALTE
MVKLLVGVGEWETEEELTMKYAFPLVLWQTEDNWNVQAVNASESPWNTEVIGKMLDRTTALENRFIKDVFHITDHIVLEDKEILGYFGK